MKTIVALPANGRLHRECAISTLYGYSVSEPSGLTFPANRSSTRTVQFLKMICLFIATVVSTAVADEAPAVPTPEATAPDDPSAGHHAWRDLAFEIEDAKSYVGIAAVKLSVSKLRPENGYLVGNYRIRIPLMRSKNDRGLIKLPLDATVADLAENGGILRGKAYSEDEDEPPNRIVCRIEPVNNRRILLAITTTKRTIEFTSQYSVVEVGRDG